jgi:hypothetical protein
MRRAAAGGTQSAGHGSEPLGAGGIHALCLTTPLKGLIDECAIHAGSAGVPAAAALPPPRTVNLELERQALAA